MLKRRVYINVQLYTDIDKVELNVDFCRIFNVVVPKKLAIVMKGVVDLLIYMSIDYVFGSKSYNVPCKEDQDTTPVDVYGLTKLGNEQNIFTTGYKHLIISMPWIYSAIRKKIREGYA